ncbi:MAG: DUF2802 domain-containing protein [Candidatus Obscuribacterales bacterium]|nr:DUF2802 domain-containing protein [Steroidobacteraceae bacterium]
MSQTLTQIMHASSLDTILIAGRAGALLVGFLLLAWSLSRWRRAVQRDTQRVFEQLDLVRGELLIIKEVLHEAAHRAEKADNEARLTPPTTNSVGRGYEIAARMARTGSSKEELIRSCGITLHEAELLIKLHCRPVAQSAVAVSRVQNVVTDNTGKAHATQPHANAKSHTTPRLETPQPSSASIPQIKRKVSSRLVAVG